MSLRMEMSGFNLDQMKKFIGSKNKKAIADLQAKFDEVTDEDLKGIERSVQMDPPQNIFSKIFNIFRKNNFETNHEIISSKERHLKERNDARGLIEDLINGTIKLKDGIESEFLINIIGGLSWYKQKHILTEVANFWKILPFIDEYFLPLQKKVDKKTAKILNYFVEGRPIIGKDFERGWSFYLYLTNKEVGQLLDAMEKYPVLTEDLEYAEGFCEQFKNSLESVYNKNKDLWIYYD